MFSVLVVTGAKCQQAWGQHPVYQVYSCSWCEGMSQTSNPSTADCTAHRQRGAWAWCESGRQNTDAEGSGVGIQLHRLSVGMGAEDHSYRELWFAFSRLSGGLVQLSV